MLYIQLNAWASYLIIPMDDTQTNHLKAYGIAYWVLENQQEVDWLLNYRGGSFLIKNKSLIEKECKIRGVTCLLYTSPSPRDLSTSRMPSSA